MDKVSRTNLLLGVIAAALIFFMWQYIQSENRAAVANVDYGRCWTEACKSDVTNRLVGH
jgi:predicted negative regulator of RcsB-dependent stress response